MSPTIEDLSRGAALLIGLGSSSEPEFRNTVELLKELLHDDRTCGLPRERIAVPDRPVKASDVTEALNGLSESNPSWLFVYLGTHGNVDGTLLMDERPDLTPTDIVTALNGQDVNRVRLVLFVDSCYSGTSLYASKNSGAYEVTNDDLESLASTRPALIVSSSRGSETSQRAAPTALGPLGVLPVTPLGLHLIEALTGAESRSEFVYTDDVELRLRRCVPETTGGTQRPIIIRRMVFPIARSIGARAGDWAEHARRLLGERPVQRLPIRVPPAYHLLLRTSRRALLTLVPTHRFLRFPGSGRAPLLENMRTLVAVACHGASLEFSSIRTRVWLRQLDDPTFDADAERVLERLARGFWPARRTMARVRLYRAIMRLAQGRLSEAERDLEQAHKLDANVAAVQFYCGVARLVRLVARLVHLMEDRTPHWWDRTKAVEEWASHFRGALEEAELHLGKVIRQCRRWFQSERPACDAKEPQDPALHVALAVQHLLESQFESQGRTALELAVKDLHQALTFPDCQPEGVVRQLWSAVRLRLETNASARSPEPISDFLAALQVLNSDTVDIGSLGEAESRLLAGWEDADLHIATAMALGALYLRRSQYGAARMLLNEAECTLYQLGRYPFTAADRAVVLLLRAFANWGLGDVAGSAGDLDLAEKWAAEATVKPQELEAAVLRLRAAVCVEYGESNRALEFTGKLEAQSLMTPDDWYVKGRALAFLDDWNGALDALTRAQGGGNDGAVGEALAYVQVHRDVTARGRLTASPRAFPRAFPMRVAAPPDRIERASSGHLALANGRFDEAEELYALAGDTWAFERALAAYLRHHASHQPSVNPAIQQYQRAADVTKRLHPDTYGVAAKLAKRELAFWCSYACPTYETQPVVAILDALIREWN